MQKWLKSIFLAILTLVAVISFATVTTSQITELKFGVGPYFPTPNENRTQFDPLFNYLASKVNLKADITIADDWVGISEALRSRTLDVAWLGPWGYVLANHNEPSIQAIATVKYKDNPFYYAVLIARADAPYNTLEEAIAFSKNQKLKLSLADVGSTSGWLIPTAEFKRLGIDPKAVFDYSEGASHAAQAIGVISEQVDIASDYDRNLDVLQETGRLDKSQIKIIWKSQPLPNDPIAIRGGLPDKIKQDLQTALVNITPQEAQQLLPKNYTGFITSDGSNYQPIQEAGKLVGRLK